ncbi:hypothetical protein PIB30_066898, partial [Stylosanthes scabra]|nr:hypothetical protein [Stylosanthes scabra]
MRYGGGRRRRMLLQPFVVLCAVVTGLGLLMLALRPMDPPITVDFPQDFDFEESNSSSFDDDGGDDAAAAMGVGDAAEDGVGEKNCATVEKMGKDFSRSVGIETLRAR